VHQLVKDGILPKASRGNYELVPSIKGYIKYLRDRSLGAIDMEENNPNIANERARLIKMQADKLAMEINEEKGKLLDAEKATSAWDNLIARCRAVLLGVPNRLANQIVAINNAQEVAQILKKAIYEALEELSTTENIGEPLDETQDETQYEIESDAE
jgi:phage terminase Nu1 subunit (DNA packaging protein)